MNLTLIKDRGHATELVSDIVHLNLLILLYMPMLLRCFTWFGNILIIQVNDTFDVKYPYHINRPIISPVAKQIRPYIDISVAKYFQSNLPAKNIQAVCRIYIMSLTMFCLADVCQLRHFFLDISNRFVRFFVKFISSISMLYTDISIYNF